MSHSNSEPPATQRQPFGDSEAVSLVPPVPRASMPQPAPEAFASMAGTLPMSASPFAGRPMPPPRPSPPRPVSAGTPPAAAAPRAAPASAAAPFSAPAFSALPAVSRAPEAVASARPVSSGPVPASPPRLSHPGPFGTIAMSAPAEEIDVVHVSGESSDVHLRVPGAHDYAAAGADENALAATVSMASSPLASPPPGQAHGPSGAWSEAAGSPRMSGGFATDAEPSLDIPPPDHVEPVAEGAEGVKDPYIGTTFDHRYKIEQVLGEGGMGVVYRARHKVIDKKVAVKVLRADMARDREILDRFLQEAKAASSIGNAHIVDISDFGDLPDGSTYFVMEYLEGRSLTQLLEAEKRLSVDRICNIALQIADGLAAAHASGIVHRDLKPDNVFLVQRGGERDFVKILDFGIAKVTNNASTKLTRAGAVFGTPHYMSPEQAAGAPIDHRTDIYSLGVMLYELTSGQLPFNADNFMGILTQHMYKAPVPIRALVPAPDCPPGLEAVVLKCLSKRPDSRYRSMEELAADLTTFRRGDVPQAVAEMMARSGGFNVPHDFFKPAQQTAIVPATPVEPRTRWPRYVWVAGAVAAVGLVTFIVVKGSDTGATPPPAASTEATTAVQAAPSPAVPEAKKVAVALAALPETAVAVRDGQELKLPASLQIEEGKPVAVEIRATGYDTVSLVLDGSERSKLVKLLPSKGAVVKQPGPGRPPTAPTKPTSQAGTRPPGPGHTAGSTSSGSEIVDPWK